MTKTETKQIMPFPKVGSRVIRRRGFGRIVSLNIPTTSQKWSDPDDGYKDVQCSVVQFLVHTSSWTIRFGSSL